MKKIPRRLLMLILIAVDFATQERRIRPGSLKYREIIMKWENGGR